MQEGGDKIINYVPKRKKKYVNKIKHQNLGRWGNRRKK